VRSSLLLFLTKASLNDKLLILFFYCLCGNQDKCVSEQLGRKGSETLRLKRYS
jgi:hypothetical protein